jgi:hypothetical protein
VPEPEGEVALPAIQKVYPEVRMTGQTGSNREGKTAYRRNGKAVTYRIAGS